MQRHRIVAFALLAVVVVVTAPAGGDVVEAADTSTFDIVGPLGSGTFGERILVLSNGNYVIGDSSFDSATTADIGAVYLYDGITNALISSLRGSSANDRIGSSGLLAVGNGNFVVRSPLWDNAGAADAGAVTWVNGSTGLNGEVSPANSLVGSTASDGVGTSTQMIAQTMNYFVTSQGWNNGAIVDAGATTWGSGATGVVGPVSAANSLVGSHAADGNSLSATTLPNGNVVVRSPNWDRGAIVDAGAATFMSGTTGRVGVISEATAIVGSHGSDRVGSSAFALTSGAYVVASTLWDNGATVDVGAVTWVNSAGSLVGPVTAANSLIGVTANDNVGSRVTALANGNYAVSSQYWDRGAIVDAGAVTWGNGATGTFGTVGVGNSWVGSRADDSIGYNTIGLSNGNFVTASGSWDNGLITDAGAATWINGSAATSGVVGTDNSLYGTHPNDLVGGIGLFAFKPGNNYVVDSAAWNNGATAQVGAITWGNGTTGTVGPVSAANSFIGATAMDTLGGSAAGSLDDLVIFYSYDVDIEGVADVGAVTIVTNELPTSGVVSASNHIVGSATDDITLGALFQTADRRLVLGAPMWNNGAIADAGSITIVSAITGSGRKITGANSLVGTHTNDHVGAIAWLLEDDNIVVGTPDWDNGVVVDTGASTWRGTSSPLVGNVTSANSIVGAANNKVGGSVVGLPDGDYFMFDRNVDTGATPDTGSVAYVPRGGAVGPLSGLSAVRGLVANGGSTMSVSGTPTAANGYVVSRPAENIVTIFTPPPKPNYVALAPARLADTRPGQTTSDGVAAGGGPLATGSTLELTVAGRGGVAGDAIAAGLNVTAVDAGGDGFLTVWPCGSPQPTASNLNFVAGSIVPNAVMAKLGVGGKVCIFVSQAADVVVDVNGYFPTTSSYVSANPARVLETRPGEVTADGQQQGAGTSAGGTVTEVQVGGRVGVPTNATAAVLNVTVTGPIANGFLTVFPCGESRPTASSLNFGTGETVANLVVSKLGAGGKVCIYTLVTAHLVVDVNGYFPAVTTYRSLNPARLLETRSGLSTIDGLFNATGLQPANTELALNVTGRGGVPADGETVVLNVTVTGPAGAGFLTLYQCGISPPLASNLNFSPGQTVANAVVVKIGTGGRVCAVASQATHIVVDVTGYFPG